MAKNNAISTLTAPLGLGTLFSYAQALANPAKPPRYIIPGTPRFRLPDFSVRISPKAPYIIMVPKGMARMIHATKLLCIITCPPYVRRGE